MSILCITSNKLYSLMNRERLDLYEAMANAQNAIVHVIEEADNAGYDLPTLIHKYQRKFNHPIQAIIFEEVLWCTKLNFTLPFRNADQVSLPKASFMSDFWLQPKELKAYIKSLNIDTLITPHDMAYPYFKKRFPEISNIIFAPFCMRRENYHVQKKRTLNVLNTNGTHPVTPFRNRLYKLLPQLSDYGVSFYQLEHPGKRLNEKTEHSKKSYIELLHQASFVIADTTMFNLGADIDKETFL